MVTNRLSGVFNVWKWLSSTRSAVKVSLKYLLNRNPNSPHKEVTEQYPDPVSSKTTDDLPPRTRGLLFNDIRQCIGCHECERVCPVQCIKIESEKREDTGKEWVSVFDIDHAQCIFCKFCVDVCPTESLIHTKRFEKSGTCREDLVESFGLGVPPERGDF